MPVFAWHFYAIFPHCGPRCIWHINVIIITIIIDCSVELRSEANEDEAEKRRSLISLAGRVISSILAMRRQTKRLTVAVHYVKWIFNSSQPPNGIVCGERGWKSAHLFIIRDELRIFIMPYQLFNCTFLIVREGFCEARLHHRVSRFLPPLNICIYVLRWKERARGGEESVCALLRLFMVCSIAFIHFLISYSLFIVHLINS